MSTLLFKEDYIRGKLHPKEYDWKNQCQQLAEDYKFSDYPPFMLIDIGKVLGLAQYACELEEENRVLKK